MKTYPLEKTHMLVLNTVVPGLLLVVGPVLLAVEGKLGVGPGDRDPRLVLFLLVEVLLGCQFLRNLRVPRRIQVDLKGRIEFLGPLVRVALSTAEVVSIRPTWEASFFVLRHEGGSIRFLNQFTGFHEFLAWLKQTNPRIELKGC